MTLDISWAIIASLAMYLLPGYALVRLPKISRGGAHAALANADAARPPARFTRAEEFAFALGAGVALPPFLLELVHLVGIQWSPWAMAVYLGAALVINLAGLRKVLLSPFRWRLGAGSLLIALTVFAMGLQLLAVKDLPAGLWGDSLHHTMMAQLLVDHGGLFSSWQPYAPMATFTYHYGFHANAAFLHWLTGIPVIKTTMFSGQIILAASAPLAYLLVSRLVRLGRITRPQLLVMSGENLASAAGLWAAVFLAFYNTIPAWLMNWGRYTQPTGQLVLVVVLVCWMELLEAQGWNPRLMALTALLTACLALTHYLVTIWGVLGVGALALAYIMRKPSARVMGRVAGVGAITGALAVGLASPWLANIASGYLTNNAQGFISGSVGAQRIAEYSALVPITPFFIKDALMALAIAGVLMALVMRQWRGALLAVWAGLIILTITPQTFGLPGAGIIDSLTGYVGLYTFIGPLAGFAAGMAQTAFDARLATRGTAARMAPRAAGGLAMLVAVAAAIGWQPQMANSNYQLLTNADAAAMTWIKANTPSDAKFFVNAFPSYGGTLLAGSDGGWWLQFLTGRVTNLPPITYGSEKMETAEQKRAVNKLGVSLRGKPMADLTPTALDLTTPAHLETLRQNGFTHVYIGAHQNPPASQADAIDASALRASRGFRQVYARDGVEIYELVDR